MLTRILLSWSSILSALGLQWRMAIIIFAVLWCFLLPSVGWFAIRNGGGLTAQWTLLPIFYSIMQVFLVMAYTNFDWNGYSKRIRQSLLQHSIESVEVLPGGEETPLLPA